MIHHQNKQTLENSKGFSLVEIVIAMALFAFVATSMTSLAVGGFSSLQQGASHVQAAALAEEGLEAVRSIRDRAWNESIYTQSGVENNAGSWEFSGEGTTETIGVFTRTITFEDVCRDASDALVTCPGIYTDVYTQRVVVDVSWTPRLGITNHVERSSYISNWESNEWVQTNWSGGGGQVIWSDTTQFLGDDGGGGLNNAVSGQLSLAASGGSAWVDYSGAVTETDTTDGDFSAANSSHSGTMVSGTGTAADVILQATPSWAAHANSGITTTNNLFDISAVSSSNIWAVGASGRIISYNGSTWATATSPVATQLNGIEMRSSSEGYAVGASGKILKYNGSTWSVNTTTAGAETWNDVAMVSSTDGFAVGNTMKVAKYSGGSTWTVSVVPGTSANVLAVDVLSASEVWAAGSNGRIYKYNGSTWSLFVDLGAQVWNDIVMVSSSYGWVTGTSGVRAVFNGTTWTASTMSPADTVNGMYAFSSSNIWAVGINGDIWNYNGSAWSIHTDTGTQTWNAMTMISTTSGFAVGNTGVIYEYKSQYPSSGIYTSGINGGAGTDTIWSTVIWSETLPSGGDISIETRTGNVVTPDGTWSVWSVAGSDSAGSLISSPIGNYIQYRVTFTRGADVAQTPHLSSITLRRNAPTGNTLYDISILSSTDMWAVGAGGVIVHYLPSFVWSPAVSPVVENLYGAKAISASNVWAVGASGKILNYAGSSWVEHIDTGTERWYDIDSATSSDIWAVGDNGALAHYNGSTWTESTITSPQNINAIEVITASDIWAVGDSGSIWHYNGSVWSTVASSTVEHLYGINAVSASDIWASGASGKILHYDGNTWSVHTDTGAQTWNDIDMISTIDGWVVGTSGALYQYNGSSWSSFTSPTTHTLIGLDSLNATTHLAVGNLGGIIKYSAGSYSVYAGILSSAFNMGSVSAVQGVSWDATIPDDCTACDIFVQLSTAPDASGSPGTWTSGYGPDGTSGTYFTNGYGEIAPALFNGNQWIRYTLELGGDGAYTPVVSEIKINYK